MKKLVLSAVVLLLGTVSSIKASEAGDLFDSVVTGSRFTILESVTPIYYYDAVEKVHQGGAMSSFYKLGNGFITADAGWVNSIEDTTQKGGAILGGSVHAVPLFRVFFPTTADYVRSLLPETSLKFVDALDFGGAFKHNFEREAFTFGFYSGVALRF